MKRLCVVLAALTLLALTGTSQSCERCFRASFIPSLKEAAASLSPLEKAKKHLEKDEGVRVEQKDKQFQILARTGTVKEPLLKVDASEEGIADARKKIAKLVIDRVEKLEAKFKVEISRDGQKAIPQRDEEEDDDGNITIVKKDLIENRRPKLDEVLGLEAVLPRAQPSNWEKSPVAGVGKGICIVFLTKPYYVDETTVLARYIDDYKTNRCALVFNPDGCSRMQAIAERDLKFDPSKPLGHSYSSIESLILHELSHHHQLRIDWWNGREKDLAEELGWKSIAGKLESYWYIKGTRKDQPKLTAWYHPASLNSNWYAYDDNGKLLDDVPALANRAEMRKLATVRPMTYYFPSPSEMYAEAVMVYRLGGQYRRSLLKDSPEMYKVVKREDQREINMTYGATRTYIASNAWYETALYIRSPEGYLVKNTPENEAEVSKFENGK